MGGEIGHDEAPPVPSSEDVDQLLGYIKLLFDKRETDNMALEILCQLQR
jgi:hypothetical protein